jgi:hypothetical protein
MVTHVHSSNTGAWYSNLQALHPGMGEASRMVSTISDSQIQGVNEEELKKKL